MTSFLSGALTFDAFHFEGTQSDYESVFSDLSVLCVIVLVVPGSKYEKCEDGVD